MLKTATINFAPNTTIVNRLIALWAFSESGLGGIMHALKIPFTGILVGGLSILFITLIAIHSKNLFATMMRALFIVLIIKLSVSPHSPVGAYFAVSLQAIIGYFIYSIFLINKLTIHILTISTFLLSALQKIIILTIVYGQSLWQALDEYILWVSKKLPLNLSEYLNSENIILVFFGIYLVSALIIAQLIQRIVKNINFVDFGSLPKHISPTLTQSNKRKSLKKHFVLLSILLLVVLFPLLFKHQSGLQKGIYILIRSSLLLATWYFIISPLVLRKIKQFLDKKNTTYQREVTDILQVFPFFNTITKLAWEQSKDLKGLNRIEYFVTTLIAFGIKYKS